MKPQCVVTLVHGTWARKTQWITPRSRLSQALRDIDAADVRLFRFVWSGRNSPAARQRAAARLERKLALRMRQYPHARHYIVCHSHGGAVALRALAAGNLLEQIDGVVCLATPFLIARERDLGPDPIKYLSGAMLAFALLVSWMIDRALPLWPGWATILVQGVGISITLGAEFALVLKWRDFATALLRGLTTPAVPPDKFLIIRSPADEASGGLSFGQFISRLTVLLFLKAQRLHAAFEAAAARWSGHRTRMVLVATAALASLFGCLIAYAELQIHHFPPYSTKLALGGFGTAFVVVFEALVVIVPGWGVGGATVGALLAVSALLWPTIVLLSLFLLLPYGWEIAAGNILLDVTAEATPLSSGSQPWPVHLIDSASTSERDDRSSLLIHSQVYDNPAVITLVCNWIADRSAKATTAEIL